MVPLLLVRMDVTVLHAIYCKLFGWRQIHPLTEGTWFQMLGAMEKGLEQSAGKYASLCALMYTPFPLCRVRGPC